MLLASNFIIKILEKRCFFLSATKKRVTITHIVYQIYPCPNKALALHTRLQTSLQFFRYLKLSNFHSLVELW